MTPTSLTTELLYLVLVATFTGLLWIPYVLNRVIVGPGVLHEVGVPDPPTRLSPWADRLKRAHTNAIENLPVFAALVLVTHALGASTQVTAVASAVFFWARIGHALSFTFAIPWVRTVAFVIGWACQMTFAFVLLRSAL